MTLEATSSRGVNDSCLLVRRALQFKAVQFGSLRLHDMNGVVIGIGRSRKRNLKARLSNRGHGERTVISGYDVHSLCHLFL